MSLGLEKCFSSREGKELRHRALEKSRQWICLLRKKGEQTRIELWNDILIKDREKSFKFERKKHKEGPKKILIDLQIRGNNKLAIPRINKSSTLASRLP
jgi:hypothetical protein